MHLSILNVMPDEDCVCTYTKIYQKLIMDFFSISEQLLTTEDVHDVRSLIVGRGPAYTGPQCWGIISLIKCFCLTKMFNVVVSMWQWIPVIGLCACNNLKYLSYNLWIKQLVTLCRKLPCNCLVVYFHSKTVSIQCCVNSEHAAKISRRTTQQQKAA